MRKIIFLILGLSLMAASCDTVDLLLGTGGGARGVFKSEDAGESYRLASSLPKGDITGVNVNAIAFDSSTSATIYLAASNGIYKTTDAAKQWRYILSGISAAGIVVDAYQPQVVYASGLSGTNGKIIKSLDGGTSWVDIYTEPSKSNPVLAIDVSKGNSSLVLAGLSSGEIIRSLAGGHTWKATKVLADRILEIEFGSSSGVYALTLHKGLFVSSDCGIAWTQATPALTAQSLSSSTSVQASVSQFDGLALDRKQPQVLYLATDQGLFRSVNDAKTWSFLSLPLKNASLRVSSAAVNPNNSNNLFVAVGSTIFQSSNGGVTWETKILPTRAEVKRIVIDPQTSNELYLGLSNP